MASYAFWNNKGGVGKSFLCFVASCEYARLHPNASVYVIDLCPQANVSETLLGGYPSGPTALGKLIKKIPRPTIGGYIEARLNAPFQKLPDISPYLTSVSKFNQLIPSNLHLVAGDNLLEILQEAIRQTSQLSVPFTAWRQVLLWVRDLTDQISQSQPNREVAFFIDCNPSFAIYTQLALAAADQVVVPFTADDSSRRGIENVIALLYGIGDSTLANYAKLNFAKRAKDDGLRTPTLSHFISNRMTIYEGKESKAFKAVSSTIKTTLDSIYSNHRSLFTHPSKKPSDGFITIPDYHSACVVSTTTGTPVHAMKAGPRIIMGERVQINITPLNKYKKALGQFVKAL
ncbi:MAG: ParA family protein [Rhodoferax sp.]